MFVKLRKARRLGTLELSFFFTADLAPALTAPRIIAFHVLDGRRRIEQTANQSIGFTLGWH